MSNKIEHPTIEITIRGPQGSGKSTIAAAICEMLAEAAIGAAVVGNEEPSPDGKAIERLYSLQGLPRVLVLTQLPAVAK
jgi:Ni2+-binding GTPase involved in maturation of urease and hydrogenase